MASKKETINTKDEQGNELVLDIRHPSGKDIQDAQVVYTKHWQYLVDEQGVKVKRQVDEMLEEKGIWTKKQQDEDTKLRKEIFNLSKKLGDKNIKKTKEQGRQIAIEILQTRGKLKDLLSERSSLDANTAEALAENVRFDYLVSVCTVYNKDGQPYFKDLEDYVARRSEVAAWEAASKLAAMVYGGVDFSENFTDNLIEVQFLKKFGFANEEGDFVDPTKGGKKVDIDGKEVSEEESIKYTNVDGKIEYEFGGFDEEPEPVQVPKEKEKKPKAEEPKE